MNLLAKWIALQIDLDNFHSTRAVYAFALKMMFRSVILACLLSVAALPLCFALGITSMSLGEAVFIAVMFSWIVGGAISGALSVVTGYVIRDLSLSRAEFRRLSRTDTLSGLLNRRAFSEALENVTDEASLAILDLDRFKSINDRHGHAAGDEVIRMVARLIVSVFPKPHVVARLGGEEFGIIIAGGDLDERSARLEHLRNQVAAARLTVKDKEIRATISVGVAEFTPERASEAVYDIADKALYLAKALGRNRVVHESAALGRIVEEAADLRPAWQADRAATS